MKLTTAAVLLTAAIIPSLASAAADTGSLSDTERAYLIEQLESSKKVFLESISGLSPAQWNFKPGPDRWSVAQCAEHIVLAEGLIFDGSQKVLSTPVVPRPEKSNAEMDHAIVAGVKSREEKHKAPEPIVPTGKYGTPDAAAAAFTEARDKNIEYAKTTSDALRVHVAPGPAGPMDSYQFLLLMAAHTARHTAQIHEVETSAGYPGK